MDGLLRLDLLVERHAADTARVRRVLQFLVERSLIVDARREPERPFGMLGRNESHRGARRDDGLPVVRPISKTNAVVYHQLALLVLFPPCVLYVSLDTV